MKMTLKEMKEVVPHDVLKYIGPSLGGLLRNKLYTVKDTSSQHIDFFMPKGQAIAIDIDDYALWEMYDAKGLAMAKERRIREMELTFKNHMNYVEGTVQELNVVAVDIDDLLKDFPLDGKMKLLSKLSKDQIEILEFLHKLKKNRLTTLALAKAFKKDK